jgi:hypothetical protein
MRLGVGRVLTAIVALAGCNDPPTPECDDGELRYNGRPAARLFDFVTKCRDDCFVGPALEGECDRDCAAIEVDSPSGALQEGGREMWLVDADSLDDDLALVYSFAYLDEAGGDAPGGWTFTAQGPATYLADHVVGSARFVMDARVVELASFDQEQPLDIAAVVSEPVTAEPGRLEVLDVDDDRIAGRFYLSYESLTGQPQGQVNGCFDLSIGAPIDIGGDTVRVLSP